MTRRIKMNKLFRMALKLSTAMADEEELRKQDLTEIYNDEKQGILDSGELLNVQVNGSPGSGKSTVMIAEVFDTNERLGKETTMDHILANQIVYIDVMRSIREQMFCCIGVDEYDELGDTGYNASIDKAALNVFSDLHRDDYVHKYACSPQDLMDKNCNIILEILATDKEKQYTRCLLYYRFVKGGQDIRQLLGFVDIDVSAALATRVYKEYYKRKQKRLRLFNEYGIRGEREIFMASVILHAYNELKEIATFQQIDHSMAEIQVEMSCREMRQMNSILKSDKDARSLLVLLKYEVTIEKMRKKVAALKAKDLIEHIPLLVNHMEKLSKKQHEALQYWHNAHSLRPLYSSNLVPATQGE